MTLYLLCLVGYAICQEVKGTVKDAETGTALPFANVFIDNTTIGTTSDGSGKFVLALPAGFALLVFSYVGYQSQTFNINPAMNETLDINVSLKPEKKELKEVRVESTRDKVWEKKFRSFEKEFLGTTPNGKKSKILNPWVVDFIDNDQDVLMATASEPIEIVNMGLGYSILFYLTRFEAGDKLYFLGRSRFTELDSVDEEQKLTWLRHRLEAYKGAEQHLFRSMIEGKIYQEGFELYVETREQKKIIRSGRFSQDLKDKLIPFTFSIMKGQTDLYKIRLPGRLEVHYINDNLHPFYRDISDRVFWIEPLQPVIEMDARGILRDPTSILESGYLRDLRLADMLPFDYEPKPLPKKK